MYKLTTCKFRIILLLGLILDIIPFAAYADQVTVGIMVDKDTAVIGDPITLVVTINGAQLPTQPEMPIPKGFIAKYFGSSSQITILNGAMNASTKHTYTLTPLKEGSFTVGPALIDYEGQKIKGQAIQLKIVSPHAIPVTEGKSDDVFLKAAVSNDLPYVKEQIVYTVQLWRRVEVAKANLNLPGFIGFSSDNLGKQHEYQKVVNGITYTVTEIKNALFPSHIGKLVIGPATAECLVASRGKKGAPGTLGGSMLSNPFQASGQAVQTVLLRSDPVEVRAKPLPLQGQPVNFSPLAGRVELTAQISKNNLKMGGYTTLTLNIFGSANIQDIQVPNPKWLEDFKIYDEKPIGSSSGQDELIGRKVLRKAFVPLKTGRLQVPEFQIPFFNPKTAMYETARSKPFIIEVSPAAEGESLHTLVAPGSAIQKDLIRILGKDILPVYTELDALQDSRQGAWRYIFYSLWLIAPVVAFLSISLAKLHKEDMIKKADFYRRSNAYKKASKSMDVAASRLHEKDGHAFYAEMSNIIKDYLGDKLLLPSGGALTPQEAEALLTAKGVNAEMSYRVRMLMEYCYLQQFAPSLVREVRPQSAPDTIIKKRILNAKHILEQLEEVLQDEPLQSA